MNEQYGFILVEQVIANMLGIILVSITYFMLSQQFEQQRKIKHINDNSLNIIELYKIIKNNIHCQSKTTKKELYIEKNKIILHCKKEGLVRSIFSQKKWPQKLIIKDSNTFAKSALQNITLFIPSSDGNHLKIQAESCQTQTNICKKINMVFRI